LYQAKRNARNGIQLLLENVKYVKEKTRERKEWMKLISESVTELEGLGKEIEVIEQVEQEREKAKKEKECKKKKKKKHMPHAP
jgi:hypothetical protein